MKPNLLFLFLALTCGTCFAQDLMYSIQGTYTHPFRKEMLENVQTMSDIIKGYPSSWITDYVSAEITATNNGNVIKITGPNDVLSVEQKELISMADLGTDVVIDVAYNRQNTVTAQMEMHVMHYTVTLIPEIEAEYTGGQEQMNEYLKVNAINKISTSDSKQMKPALVKFTITEHGKIADAHIATSSGVKKVDRILLQTIQQMPNWRPAENATGIKVKQGFQFSVGNTGC